MRNIAVLMWRCQLVASLLVPVSPSCFPVYAVKNVCIWDRSIRARKVTNVAVQMQLSIMMSIESVEAL